MFRTLVRRAAKAALIGGLAAIVTTWFRRRDPEIVESRLPGDAQWRPLTPPPPAPSVAPDASDHPVAEPSDGTAAEAPREWVEPDPEGECPLTHPVKVKKRSGIYHVPEGLAYERTNADRCYASPEAAEADGYRASKM